MGGEESGGRVVRSGEGREGDKEPTRGWGWAR
jgi:hypothetical protein